MIQYHLLRRKLDRWPNFKCRFPFTVMRKMLLELCNRFKFVTSLSSLTLHTVNLLLWKKILSLTLFKIIAVSRTTTLIRIFLKERSDIPLREGTGRGSPCKVCMQELSSSVGYHPHQKSRFLSLSWPQTTYWEKKVTLIAFTKTFACGFSYTIMTLFQKARWN